MQINSPKELNVYKKAYAPAMEIFELSKRFPEEKRFVLTSQIRRSSALHLPELTRGMGKTPLRSALDQ
jgi:hypothetical protein